MKRVLPLTKDERKLIYSKLTLLEFITIQMAYNSQYRPTTNITNLCAFHGYLELLKWAIDAGFPWNSRIYANAAMGGHLNILKWREEECHDGVLINDSVYKMALQYGHLHILQWAVSRGGWITRKMCNRATNYGHLHILKWMHEHLVFEFPWRSVYMRAKDTHIIDWVRAHRLEREFYI